MPLSRIRPLARFGLGLSLIVALAVLYHSCTRPTVPAGITNVDRPFFIAAITPDALESDDAAIREAAGGKSRLWLARVATEGQGYEMWELQRGATGPDGIYNPDEVSDDGSDCCAFTYDVPARYVQPLSPAEVLPHLKTRDRVTVKGLERESVYHPFNSLYVLIRDLNRDGEPDMLLKLRRNHPTGDTEEVLGYHLRDGRAVPFFGYTLSESEYGFLGLWDIAWLRLTPQGTLSSYLYLPQDNPHPATGPYARITFNQAEHRYEARPLPVWSAPIAIVSVLHSAVSAWFSGEQVCASIPCLLFGGGIWFGIRMARRKVARGG